MIILGAVVTIVGLILVWPTVAQANGSILYWQIDEMTPPPMDDSYNNQDGICVGQCPATAEGQIETSCQNHGEIRTTFKSSLQVF
jgi:hypothetical protein